MFFIKNIIYFFVRFFFSLWYYVYTYELSRKIRTKIDRFYTIWISNNIYKIGRTSTIGSDCFLLGGKYIEIGEYTCIGRHSVITCWDNYMGEKFTPSIKIGNECSIGEYCHITSINSITIGNGVLTGRRVTITDNSHGASLLEELKIRPSKRNLYSKGEIVIGDNVWIGDKVSITSGVHIGEGAIIAANAVVTKDIPQNVVAGGIPAKVLKMIL